MSRRGLVPRYGTYLFFSLVGFLLASILMTVFTPQRAHALMPELLQSTTSVLQKTTNRTTRLVPILRPILQPSSPAPSTGGGSNSPSDSVSSSGSATPVGETNTPQDTDNEGQKAGTYTPLALAAAPLTPVQKPVATLASTAATPARNTSINDGQQRLVLLEPSDEGWRFIGIAWYWWLACAIIFAAASIVMREFKRFAVVKEV